VSFIEDRPAASGPATITVPKSAVKGSGGQSFVWELRAGTVHRVSVVRGAETETGVEISTGLRGGEQLVTASAVPLSEGQRVNQAH